MKSSLILWCNETFVDFLIMISPVAWLTSINMISLWLKPMNKAMDMKRKVTIFGNSLGITMFRIALKII
ncbi:hypothetical protein XI25_30505 [Paenibacillus sp. DMB20]|nr:hypothetical protein XI25_30505 [Paenibacillus sp. DMB20]